MSNKAQKVDLVLGIPSFNEADNVGFVAHQLALGAKQYFPQLSSLIINVDNNSPDNTEEAFLRADTEDVPKKYISTEQGIVGKGNNLRNLFEAIDLIEPKAVVLVDADLKSITPEWVKILAEPILEGYDYATPLYSRNEYDGTITNHICYPLIYGLYGMDIRQPIGGDFAFSSKMAKHWLNIEWKESTKQYGIDIFMTTTALLNGFKTCQVVLGSKVHKPSAPKLGPMFSQVVSTLFENISRFKEPWLIGKSENGCRVFGECTFHEPQSLSVDYKDIKRKSLGEFSAMEEIISKILPPQKYRELKEMHKRKRWKIGSKLWLEIVYAFVHAYDKAEGDKETFIEALKPLCFARVATFYRETMELDHYEAEEKIRKQAFLFQKNKGLLVNRFQNKGLYN